MSQGSKQSYPFAYSICGWYELLSKKQSGQQAENMQGRLTLRDSHGEEAYSNFM